MSYDLANAYLAQNNIKGFSNKALAVINEDLRKFAKFDVDNTGCLDKDEVKKLLMQEYVANEYGEGFATDTDAENFLSELDDDGNDKISKGEFLQKIILSWANRTYFPQFFRILRKDHNLGQGTSGKRQLYYEMFADEGYTQQEIDAFIDKQDLEVDGLIDLKSYLDEFFDVGPR